MYTKVCNNFKYLRVSWFYCSVLLKIVHNLTVLYGVMCNILEDPFFFVQICVQMVTRNFGMDVHCVVSEDDTRHYLEIIVDDDNAANDAVRPFPSALRHANDRERNDELADVLNRTLRTEIMVPSFHKEGHLTLKLCQLFLETARHPDLDVKELRSETIVHLFR